MPLAAWTCARPRRRRSPTRSWTMSRGGAGRARARADALGGDHLPAEARTGAGSLAYLVPALASGRKVVVATATKALQRSCSRRTSRSPRGCSAATYASQSSRDAATLPQGAPRLRAARRAAVAAGGRRRGVRPSAPLVRRDGDRRSSRARRASRHALERAGGRRRWLPRPQVPVRRHVLLGSGSPPSARAADLVIVNHALYFADLGLREETDASILPEHEAVVFDEAHRLEDTAASWLGGSVSTWALSRLERDIGRACIEAGVPVPANALDRVRRAGMSLIRSVAPGTGRRRLREPPLVKGRVLVDRLSELAVTLTGANDELDLLALRARGGGTHGSLPRGRRPRSRRLGGTGRDRMGAGGRLAPSARSAVGWGSDGDSRLCDADDRGRLRLRTRPARPARRAR